MAKENKVNTLYCVLNTSELSAKNLVDSCAYAPKKYYIVLENRPPHLDGTRRPGRSEVQLESILAAEGLPMGEVKGKDQAI